MARRYSAVCRTQITHGTWTYAGVWVWVEVVARYVLMSEAAAVLRDELIAALIGSLPALSHSQLLQPRWRHTGAPSSRIRMSHDVRFVLSIGVIAAVWPFITAPSSWLDTTKYGDNKVTCLSFNRCVIQEQLWIRVDWTKLTLFCVLRQWWNVDLAIFSMFGGSGTHTKGAPENIAVYRTTVHWHFLAYVQL